MHNINAISSFTNSPAFIARATYLIALDILTCLLFNSVTSLKLLEHSHLIQCCIGNSWFTVACMCASALQLDWDELGKEWCLVFFCFP